MPKGLTTISSLLPRGNSRYTAHDISVLIGLRLRDKGLFLLQQKYRLANLQGSSEIYFVIPAVASGAVDCYLDKEKQNTSNNLQSVAACDDVFDEINPSISSLENAKVRILFPCFHDEVWSVIEIEIIKKQSNYQINIHVCNFFNEKIVQDDIVNKIKEAIQRRIKSCNSNAEFIFSFNSSPNLTVSGDDKESASGLRVIEDLLSRIPGALVSKDNEKFDEPIEIRRKNIDFVETTLPDENSFKGDFLFRHKRWPDLVLEPNQVFTLMPDVNDETQNGKSSQLLFGQIVVPVGATLILKNVHLIGESINIQGKIEIINECFLSVAYPRVEEEFKQQLDGWRKSNKPTSVLFIYSVSLKKWEAYLLKNNTEGLEKKLIEVDSVFNQELKKINETNISAYNINNLLNLLEGNNLFDGKIFNITCVAAIEHFNLAKEGQIEFDLLRLNMKEATLHGQCLKKSDSIANKTKDVIKASKKIIFHKGEKLVAHELFMRAPEIDMQGDVEVKQSTIISADWLMQWGSIYSPTTHYKIDQAMINLGTTTGSKVTIDAAALINFWRLRGSTNLTVHALADLNFGLTQSYNYSSSSLIKFSTAHVPDVPDSWSDVFSWSAAISSAKTVACPAASYAVNLASSVYGLYGAAKGLYSEVKELYGRSQDKSYQLKLSDFLPLVASIKEAGSSIAQTAKAAKKPNKSPGKSKNGEKENEKQKDSNKKSSFIKGAKKTAKAVVTIIAPKYSDDSLLSISGATVSGSVNQRNIWGANGAIAAGSVVIHSQRTQHLGYLASIDTVVTGGELVSHGATYAVDSLYMELDRLTVKEGSMLYGFDPQIAVKNASIYGTVTLKGGKPEATSKESSSQQQANTTAETSNTDKPQVQIDITEKLDIGKNGKFTADGLTVQIEGLAARGEITFADGSDVKVTTAKVEKSGSFAVKNSKCSGEVYLSEGETKLTQATVTFKQTFKNNGHAESDNASVSTGFFSQSGTWDHAHELSIQADKKVLATETSHFQKQGDDSVLHIKSKEEDLHGRMDAATLILDADKLNNQGVIVASTELAAKISDYTGAEGSKLISENKSQVKFGNAQVAGEVTLKNKPASQPAEQTQASTSEPTQPSNTSASTSEQPKPQIVANTVTVTGEGRFNVAGSIAQIDHLATTDQSQATFITSKVTGKSVTVSDTSKFTATGTQYTGDTYTSNGKTELTDSVMAFQQSFKDTGYTKTDNVKISTGEYSKDGVLDFSHQLSIQADKKVLATETSHFQKQGDDSVLHIKSKAEDLRGRVDTATLVLDVEQLKDASQVISGTGRFSQLHVSDELACKTDQDVVLDKITRRQCRIGLTAPTIDVAAKTETAKSLFLEATQGDVKIAAELKAGHDSENIGLLLKAKGKVINDASTLQSDGNNIILATKGYVGVTRSETHVEEHTEKSWLDLKEERVRTTHTTFQEATLISHNGKNQVISEQGGIDSTAAAFVAKAGTELVAKEDINLGGIKYTQESSTDKSYLWGLWGSQSKDAHQHLKPTFIYDVGNSKIHTAKNIHASGVVVLGPGHLDIEAKNAHFAAEKLKHSASYSTQGFDLSAFGVPAVKMLSHGQNPVPALFFEDSTLNKAAELFKSDGTTVAFANTCNLGIESYNAVNSLCRGYQTGTLPGEVLQRYGLGGEPGFAPQVTLNFATTTTDHKYDTIDGSNIQRGSISAKVTDTLTFDGLPVTTQHLTVRGKCFVQNGIALNSSTQTATDIVSVGCTPNGVTHVGFAHSESEELAKAYAYQQTRVDGKVDIQVEEWILDAATTHAQEIVGSVDTITKISRQNIKHSSSTSIAANTLGFVSVSVSESDSAVTQQPSDIVADMQGLSVNNVKSIAPTDYEHRSGIGISALLADFLPSSTSDEKPNKNAVSVASVYYENDSGAVHLDVPVKVDTQSPQNISGALQKLFEKPTPSSISLSPENTTQIQLLPQTSVVTTDINPLETISDVRLSVDQPLEKASNNSLLQTEPLQTDDGSKMEEQQRKTFVLLGKTEKSKLTVLDTDFSPQTHDVKMSWKNARNGGDQDYCLESGRYINTEGVVKKIKSENAKREISHQVKVAFERELFSSDKTVYWQTDRQFNYKDHVIRPMLVDDNGHGYFFAEFDPAQSQINVQLELGRVARFNLAQGSQDIPNLGKCEYAVDAGSIMALLSATASNERKLDLQVSGEAGVLGPNAGGKISSAELCLFGFTLQCEASANAGVGAKISAGAGITLDKTQLRLRPYLKWGGYLGPGAETSLAVNVAFDTDLPRRVNEASHKSIEAAMNSDEYKKFRDECRRGIGKLEKENPTTFWQTFWNEWQKSSIQEALDDQVEAMGVQASGNALLAMVTVRKEEAVSQPNLKQAENMASVGLFAQKQMQQTKAEVAQTQINKPIEITPVSSLMK